MSRAPLVALLVAVVLAVACCSTAAQQPAATKLANQLRVAAVQMRSSRDIMDNSHRMTAFIRRCATNGIRVAVFPECALTGYFAGSITNLTSAQIHAGLNEVCHACRNAGIYAIVGTAFREGTKLFDSALVIEPTGEILARYDKIQLAEDWPSAGEHLLLFRIDGVPCSIIICHDERYPELVRLPVLAGARVIFYVSHESGLREEQKLVPYRAQIQARAVENTVYVVQANAPANADKTGSHGQSRIVAPDGNIVHEASIAGEEVVTAVLDLRKATAANARNSVERGPLKDWWGNGMRQVRIVE